MKIQELYDRDIERQINPAVVVSEMKDYYINQEIEEYVMTAGITKNIYKFLDALVNKETGKTGVWISGYYGSGKSHFIKYLFYCLSERYRNKAFDLFKESVKELDPLDEPNLSLVESIERKLKDLSIEEIIFNIDKVADHKSEKDRITRVFLNQLNAFRGYNNNNIALALYLEKPLAKSGNYKKFKQRIKEDFKEEWDGNQIRFVKTYLTKVIEIAKEFDADIDAESLKASIKDKDQDYTIDFLVGEFAEYVKEKPKDYKLLFLLDEVSQYIGSNTSLLLNLQTIIEELGERLGTKVWVVCTAQQDLSNLINNTDSRTEDFGKILGRFETIISLESQDAAYITKKRILDKEAKGIGALNEYYKDNKGAVENQFIFDHDLYVNYESREDFVLTYPFVPYQFRLISDVFESFSNVGYVGEGVRNTERAILGITHFTANLCKEEGVGYFVPFDLFFNEQLKKNLSNHARGIVDRAYHLNEIKNDEFAIRVVNTLFMISSLGDTQGVNFPASVENIALLLIDSVNTAKQDMQNKVDKILDVLVNKNIVQVTEGKYRFLKEDEIDVANLIKNTTITKEDRLKYINDDIIKKIIKINPRFNIGNKELKLSINIDDKEIFSTGDFNLRFSIFDTSDIVNLAHTTSSKDMVVCLCDWFNKDENIKSKLLTYVRTQKYISQNNNTGGKRSDTLSMFREANKLILREIQMRFEKMFMETALISNNQLLQSNEFKASTVQSRMDEMLRVHVGEIYKKHSLSNGYAVSSKDLSTNANSKQQDAFTSLSPAEEELNNRISLLGEGSVVGDIVKDFEKAPYGWKDISTLDILVQLVRKGLRRFEWRNESIELAVFVVKALNTRERDAITVHKERVHSKEEMDDFINIINNEIFAETLLDSSIQEYKKLIEQFKAKIGIKLSALNKLKNELEGYPLVSNVKDYWNILSEIHQHRSDDTLIEKININKISLKDLRDVNEYVNEFADSNFSNYISIRKFVEDNRTNFSSLSEDNQDKAESLSNYLKIDSKPWDRYPEMRKAHKELKKAIKERIEGLKAEAKDTYERIFEDISSRKKELGIEQANITANPVYTIEKIEKEQNISKLDIVKLKASDFKAEQIKHLDNHIAEHKAKEKGEIFVASVDVSIVAEMEPTTIENAEQLDEYIEKLRNRLMVKLAKNKKIYIK